MIIRIKRKYFGTLEDMLNDDDIAKMYEQTGDTSYSNNNTNTADTNVEKGKKLIKKMTESTGMSMEDLI